MMTDNLLINPTNAQIEALYQRAQGRSTCFQDLRGLLAGDDLYLWPTVDCTHEEVRDTLGLEWPVHHFYLDVQNGLYVIGGTGGPLAEKHPIISRRLKTEEEERKAA